MPVQKETCFGNSRRRIKYCTTYVHHRYYSFEFYDLDLVNANKGVKDEMFVDIAIRQIKNVCLEFVRFP